jgi:hypothetical protein
MDKFNRSKHRQFDFELSGAKRRNRASPMFQSQQFMKPPLSTTSNRHQYLSPTVAAGGGAISTTTGDSTLFRESLMLPCLAT